MSFLQFITNPLSNLFIVAEKQKLDLTFQVCIFVLPLMSMIISLHIWGSIYATLISYSLIYSILYIVNLFLSYQISRGKLQEKVS